jgi:hypothetical protein
MEHVMKRIIALAFAAASIAGGPALIVASASPALAQTQCGPDVPEAWKRPGGFCDQAGSKGSLSEPGDGCSYEEELLHTTLREMEYGESIEVAMVPCYDPCAALSSWSPMDDVPTAQFELAACIATEAL